MTESDPDPHQPSAAIILAAGRGERMRSRRAAVLHPVAGRPLGYYPARSARAAGCAPVVVACAPEAAALRDGLISATVCVAETSMGLLEAALSAIPETVSSVLIVSGAMPLLTSETLSRLVRRQRETSGPLIVLNAHSPDSSRRNADGHAQDGRRGGDFPSPRPSPQGEGVKIGGPPQGEGAPIGVSVQGEGVMCGGPAADAPGQGAAAEAASPGAVCVSRAWLWEHRDAFLAQGEDFVAHSEDFVTTLTALAVAEGDTIETVCPAGGDGELLYVADRGDMARAEGVLRARIRARALRRGVTLADPATVWIDDTVTFGQDVTVLPNCHLYGDTHVGDNCTLGPSTRLQDTRLAANVTVMESVLEGVAVGENVRIGPFAHLRPGTVVGRDVEIGNYAELKNTRVHAGAKIHHVSYLGDAVVGSGANIGAGTITCNYDGAAKHETEIGAGAFIGSGTLLVAPVRVGDNALTGAGAVVTRDVPPETKAYGVPARVRGARANKKREENRTDERQGT